MSADPKQPVTRTTLCLLLGVCAGVSSLLYVRHRRAKTCHEESRPCGGAAIEGVRPELGDILLFRHAHGLNKLITGFTGSPFYHAALYAGDGNTVEARTPGVVRQDLRGREGDYVVIPAPEGKGKAALAWAETQVGDAYDDMDIAVIILNHLCRFLHFNYTPRNKFSCGEFVAIAFDKAGVALFPEQDLSDVVPGDFARFAGSARS